MATVYIALLTFVAATVGTITGFGTSTLMIPILVRFFPPLEAIFLVAIIHWFGDVWKIALFRKGFDLRLFGIVGLAASYLGASASLGRMNSSCSGCWAHFWWRTLSSCCSSPNSRFPLAM